MTTEDQGSVTPRTAVERWKNKEINGTALMRLLVSYQDWMVPVSEAAAGEMLQQGSVSRIMFSKDPQGVTRLFIFTDGEAYDRFNKAGAEAGAQLFLTTRGTWVFRMPLEDIDFIAIDAGSPHEIAYGKDLFPRLKQMADAIEIEEALLELRTSANPREGLLATVRDYKNYGISIQKNGEDIRLGIAPDAKGRTLAAVFTSEEAFDAYYEEGKRLQPEGELVRLNLPGGALFEQLLKTQLVGIVFNCSGPPKPVAFARQFAQFALNA